MILNDGQVFAGCETLPQHQANIILNVQTLSYDLYRLLIRLVGDQQSDVLERFIQLRVTIYQIGLITWYPLTKLST